MLLKSEILLESLEDFWIATEEVMTTPKIIAIIMIEVKISIKVKPASLGISFRVTQTSMGSKWIYWRWVLQKTFVRGGSGFSKKVQTFHVVKFEEGSPGATAPKPTGHVLPQGEVLTGSRGVPVAMQ